MFWGKNKKTDKQKKSDQELQAVKNGLNNNEKSQSELSVGTSDRQRIREEALANARKAREAIGEDTLQRIAAAMERKQNSATERAKATIQQTDADRVAMEIMAMMDED